MHRCENLHAGAEQSVVAYPDFTYVEHDTVEVEEHPLTEVDVRSVITVERRLHPRRIATRTE